MVLWHMVRILILIIIIQLKSLFYKSTKTLTLIDKTTTLLSVYGLVSVMLVGHWFPFTHDRSRFETECSSFTIFEPVLVINVFKYLTIVIIDFIYVFIFSWKSMLLHLD